MQFFSFVRTTGSERFFTPISRLAMSGFVQEIFIVSYFDASLPSSLGSCSSGNVPSEKLFYLYSLGTKFLLDTL